ncbi:hypothetical protein ACIBL3_00985 [Kribbella sp. NPDC050124]|uniref:hypothetical protein n=1 Tax=Kribbella sp. NPDC050124 TaxID=3364114 RepID=UPI003793EE9A
MVRAVGLAVTALLLGSCGDTGSADRPVPTATRSVPSPTATLPEPTRSPDREETTASAEPTRTRSPERGETTSPPERSEPPSPTQPESTRSSETQAAPSPTQAAPPSPARSSVPQAAPSPTQPAQEPTSAESSERAQTTAPTQAASPTGPPSTISPSVEPTSAESDGTPAWLWVLGLIVLALAVGIPLLVRASHRRDWRADLAAAEEEVAWFARVLIPELRQQPSPAAAAGAWNIAEGRVAAVEDRLTALEPAAPDESAQQRAITLRDAVRAARGEIRDLLASGRPDTFSQELGAVAWRLEQVLGVPDPLA